jgi:hypothetical protein
MEPIQTLPVPDRPTILHCIRVSVGDSSAQHFSVLETLFADPSLANETTLWDSVDVAFFHSTVTYNLGLQCLLCFSPSSENVLD